MVGTGCDKQDTSSAGGKLMNRVTGLLMAVCMLVAFEAVAANTATEEISSNNKQPDQAEVQNIEVQRTQRSVVEIQRQTEEQIQQRKEAAASFRPDEEALWQLYEQGDLPGLRKAIVERTQQQPQWKMSDELLQAMQQKDTDERMLWNLYHQKKYAEVYRRMDELTKLYPGWAPSEGLVEALQAARNDEREIWMLVKEGEVEQAEAVIAERHQFDKQWEPSKNLKTAIRQLKTDERPLWELLHQGDETALQQRVALLKQQFPDWEMSNELRAAIEHPDGTDTAIWDAIHEQKFEDASKAMHDRQQANPDWQPSEDMRSALHNGVVDARLSHANKNKNWAQVLRIQSDYKDAFDCSHYYRRFTLADALMQKGDANAATEVYESSLWQCKEYIRLDTIEHALDRLPAENLVPLFDVLQTRKDSKLAKPRMAMARYRFVMKKGIEQKDLPALLSDEPYLMASGDEKVVSSLAWNYLAVGEHARALHLFQQARKVSDYDDLLKGEILALDRMDDMQALKNLILQQHDRLKKAGLLEDVLPLLAKACSSKAEEQCKVQALTELETYRPLTADESEVIAWGLYNVDRYAEAADRFAELYTVDASENMTKGVYISAHKTGQMDRAYQLAEDIGGPLVELLENRFGDEMYTRKRFHAAQAMAKEPVPELENVDSSFVRGGYRMSVNRRPGIEPVRLKLHRQDYVLKGKDYLDDKLSTSLSVEVDRIYLDSGPSIVFPGDLVGTAPIIPIAPIHNVKVNIQGYEWQVGYEHEGWRSHYFHIGQGLIGGPVAAKIKGDLGMVQQLDQGFVGVKAYIEPVRDFLVTYAGLQDPFGGQRWGKTMRYGLLTEGYNKIPNFDWADSFGISYQVKGEFLKGSNVRFNSHYSADLSLPYSFRYRQSIISVGPDVRVERYRANHQHFTIGYGGYFSPQHWITYGVNGQIVSDEAMDHSYRVFASSGYQIATQDGSAVLPLTPDGRMYPTTKIKQRSDSIEAQFLQKVTPNLHVEVGAKSSRSSLAQLGVISNFTTLQAHIFATWYFDPRPTTFSSDLETFR
ncbi:MAG: hypothetical protein COS35_11365 [Zetaproteobacteria bacterium CG02_land_8_20_14_3_00_50_9]|nr:MAG: hypothetical protein COW62_12920 [Zetaproteobacteria bacterium CG17_big_fil_post_rev_8_21_14_2_50_50_13]PIV29563.1 MAG: hypothetical protein COS35_11365 [Zetaproteobacteria bacterium CG02_land_8_20_14_3_00_50_9]